MEHENIHSLIKITKDKTFIGQRRIFTENGTKFGIISRKVYSNTVPIT